MHDQLHDDLDHAIDALNDAEKLAMIERIARSLHQAHHDASVQVVRLQKETFERLQVKLARLSREPDPYEQLGFSNDAHDRILYDLEQS